MQQLSDKAYEVFTWADKEAIKEIAVNFFYHWHNSPGTNTADGFDEWMKTQARCIQCGARTPEEAQTKCICSGDNDYCHGQQLWPDA